MIYTMVVLILCWSLITVNLILIINITDMERLRSQAALAAFLSELGEAVEQAELVRHSLLVMMVYKFIL